MNNKAKILIEEVLAMSEDPHNQPTPLDLAEKMVDSVDWKPARKNLVIANLEFVYLLKKRIMMINLHFMTTCPIKAKKAIAMGIPRNNIILFKYKDSKPLLDRIMKFDTIIMNPPYNPNAVWSRFVEFAMDSLEKDGKLVAIHPATWRESTKYDALAEKLKAGISELHIMDYEAFKENKVATKTDWYVWQRNYVGEQIVTYSNGERRTVNLRNSERILRVPPDSIPARILKKIVGNKHNGLIKMDTAFSVPVHDSEGSFKQCGGKGKNGAVDASGGWMKNIFTLTKEPTEYQYHNKVVSSHIGKPRARFFSKDDETGVVLGYVWLTDNKSLPILLNSTMLYKCALAVIDPESGFKTHGTPLRPIPSWILENLKFEQLNVKTDDELYIHFGLSEEEIKWCEL